MSGTLESSVLGKQGKRAWIIIHIVLPLVPFIVTGTIRLIISGCAFSLDTFNASTMVISVCYLSFLVYRSIRGSQPVIPSEDEDEERKGHTALFATYAVIGLILFGILIFIAAEKEFELIEHHYTGTFKILVFVLSWIPVAHACRVQHTFKLKAQL